MTEKTRKIIEHAEKTGTPIFVLTAKDKASVETLIDYRTNCENIDCDMGHIDAIDNRIDEFRAWSFKNEDKMKLPD